jgi:hypothetical protein
MKLLNWLLSLIGFGSSNNASAPALTDCAQAGDYLKSVATYFTDPEGSNTAVIADLNAACDRVAAAGKVHVVLRDLTLLALNNPDWGVLREVKDSAHTAVYAEVASLLTNRESRHSKWNALFDKVEQIRFENLLDFSHYSWAVSDCVALFETFTGQSKPKATVDVVKHIVFRVMGTKGADKAEGKDEFRRIQRETGDYVIAEFKKLLDANAA